MFSTYQNEKEITRLAFDMNARDFNSVLEAKFNTRHPPRGSIIYSEIHIDYLSIKYNLFKTYDINTPFDREIKIIEEWANQHGILPDLENRLYTWSVFSYEQMAMLVRLFLDLPDQETKTLFALCFPHIEIGNK